MGVGEGTGMGGTGAGMSSWMTHKHQQVIVNADIRYMHTWIGSMVTFRMGTVVSFNTVTIIAGI
jgi:hypothetical protein